MYTKERATAKPGTISSMAEIRADISNKNRSRRTVFKLAKVETSQ